MSTATRAWYAGTTEPKKTNPQRQFIVVEVEMPHVGHYGHRTRMRLTYGCTFAVKPGDAVRCPPTRLNDAWTTGVVIAMGTQGYRGKVKYVAKSKYPRRAAA